ncbi:hypothetical protein [Deinococcus radiotolerans]|uniref:MarR family transcriptional regulator n=1 Tax=Deinococcus radiotolerans TaxID=1309407 RepID=A0ABQ2FPZ8_9DEIO|nr:hypothetical protein [Deinococcus radiotolerans]GGL15501.1 hypothetical protein GCM10010844_37960 [Deinococcus radiotolerans]
MITYLTQLETRLLIVLAHLHPGACTPQRLTQALDATPTQYALAAETLRDRRYAVLSTPGLAVTQAGERLVRAHLAEQHAATAHRRTPTPRQEHAA